MYTMYLMYIYLHKIELIFEGFLVSAHLLSLFNLWFFS